MRYLYSLPLSILVFLVILLLTTLIIKIIVTFIKILIRKENIIDNIFDISLMLYFSTILGVVASVLRHITERTYSFDYYLIIRYMAIIPIIIGIINIIINKKYKDILMIITMIILLPIFDNIFNDNYKYLFLIISLYYFIYCLYDSLSLYEYLKHNITYMSIKEALDSLPIGIILANNKNKIIFNNIMMINILKFNDIDSRIKVIDLWNLIKEKDLMFSEFDLALLKYNEEYYMLNLNKNQDFKYQIKATNVTIEFEAINEIIKANHILLEQENILKEYLDKVEEVENEKSLIRIKGRVHDVFAQRLSIIHQYLDNEDIKNIDTKKIKELLMSMTSDIKEENDISLSDVKENIISTFKLVGMDIVFDGDLVNKTKEGAILKIIREGATNALRHGMATRMDVLIENDVVTITNNGKNPSTIKEGNGIKNMRFISRENDLILEILLNPYRIIIK